MALSSLSSDCRDISPLTSRLFLIFIQHQRPEMNLGLFLMGGSDNQVLVLVLDCEAQ